MFPVVPHMVVAIPVPSLPACICRYACRLVVIVLLVALYSPASSSSWLFNNLL
jgi:hypothetical protein